MATGAKLITTTKNRLKPGKTLCKTIEETQGTIATLVPSVLRLTPVPQTSHLRLLISAGEPLTKDIINKWASHTTLLNAYGLTETTVCATISEKLAPNALPTVGRALPGNKIHVLNSHKLPCKPYEKGEIWITGTSVARGYLEKNSTRKFDKLTYTGDQGYIDENNNLFIIGRLDNQVKINGQRVSIEEVEYYLNQVSCIKEAAVIKSKHGEKEFMTAYVTVDQPVIKIDLRQIRKQLSNLIPAHMIPKAFVLRNHIPKTISNKIDKLSL